jgi:ribosomal protein S24E
MSGEALSGTSSREDIRAAVAATFGCNSDRVNVYLVTEPSMYWRDQRAGFHVYVHVRHVAEEHAS